MESKQKIHNINQIRHERRFNTHERQSSLDSNQFQRTPKWLNKQPLTDTTVPFVYQSNLRNQNKNQNTQLSIYGTKAQYNMPKFNPDQNISELLSNFQVIFKKLISLCSKQHRQFVLICTKQYYKLKQILTHYEQSKHLQPYFYKMHINSTNTKQNLLKMLIDEQNDNKLEKQQNLNLKDQIKKLKKLIKCKDQAYFGLADKKKELQMKITHMGTIIRSYQDDEIKYKEALKQKDQMLKQLQQNKQNIMKDLQEHRNKIQTLNYIGENPSNSSLPKKRSCKILGTNSYKQKKQKKQKIKQHSNLQYHTINNTDEDLYRFLFIQADTIQQQIKEDEDY